MSEVQRFSEPFGMDFIPLTHPSIVSLLFPSQLYDADGIELEGKHWAVNLVSGMVWHLIGHDDETNPILSVRQHKAPLTLRHLETETVLSGKKRERLTK